MTNALTPSTTYFWCASQMAHISFICCCLHIFFLSLFFPRSTLLSAILAANPGYGGIRTSSKRILPVPMSQSNITGEGILYHMICAIKILLHRFCADSRKYRWNVDHVVPWKHPSPYTVSLYQSSSNIIFRISKIFSVRTSWVGLFTYRHFPVRYRGGIQHQYTVAYTTNTSLDKHPTPFLGERGRERVRSNDHHLPSAQPTVGRAENQSRRNPKQTCRTRCLLLPFLRVMRDTER